jgi:hypothetical protein
MSSCLTAAPQMARRSNVEQLQQKEKFLLLEITFENHKL